ncbi:N,N-dimethylformamidase beta subunit family domain-containing protein, partial [Methylobacterium crusticola]
MSFIDRSMLQASYAPARLVAALKRWRGVLGAEAVEDEPVRSTDAGWEIAEGNAAPDPVPVGLRPAGTGADWLRVPAIPGSSPSILPSATPADAAGSPGAAALGGAGSRGADLTAAPAELTPSPLPASAEPFRLSAAAAPAGPESGSAASPAAASVAAPADPTIVLAADAPVGSGTAAGDAVLPSNPTAHPSALAGIASGAAAQANIVACCGTCGYVNCPMRPLEQLAGSGTVINGQLPGQGASSTNWQLPGAPLVGGGGATAATQAGTLSGPVTMMTVSQAAAAPTAVNPIVLENQKTGNPESEWGIDGSGDSNIEGFATDISVDHGQTVDFKINTDSTNYRIDIYRLGYYGGMGARKVGTIQHTGLQNQPTPLVDATTGEVDAGNWSVSASW